MICITIYTVIPMGLSNPKMATFISLFKSKLPIKLMTLFNNRNKDKLIIIDILPAGFNFQARYECEVCVDIFIISL
ncbi:Uncharacterised protein [Streptococcus pneumoniae]|nr:Uncharacterised protein [Streptococcus pneumoniae]